ncbi:MAG TPA: methyltransferase domain-containing protein, partial [Nitrososphaeraceae archaeon]
HFDTIDQAQSPEFFIKFVDEGNKIESVQACKKLMSSLLNIGNNQSILDVGCGTGDDVISLAELVGNTGRVTGVDNSEKMIMEARKRYELKAKEKLPTVEFHIGNVLHLDFADNSFDCSRAERLLIHIDDPRKAIAEMVRVTKSGGRIVIFDLDMDGAMVNHNNRTLTRKIMHLMCYSVVNGWIGRQLPSLFKEAGLRNIKIVPHVLLSHYTLFVHICNGIIKNALQSGALTEDEYKQMWSYLERKDQEGEFLAAIPGFIVYGQKP